MKLLSDACPDPKKVLKLNSKRLARHVLGCLSGTDEPNIERAIIAKTLSSNYHQSFVQEVTHAIEESLNWLITHCLLGARPYNQELVFLTQKGKSRAAGYQSMRQAPFFAGTKIGCTATYPEWQNHSLKQLHEGANNA